MNGGNRDRIRDELKLLYQTMMPMSKKMLETEGFLTPAMFALTPKGVAIIGMVFDTQESKREAYQRLGKKLRGEMRARGAMLINEAWYLNVKREDMTELKFERLQQVGKVAVLPSEHPDRRECVTCVLVTYGWSESHTLPFHREGKKIVWEPELDASERITNWIFPTFDEGIH